MAGSEVYLAVVAALAGLVFTGQTGIAQGVSSRKSVHYSDIAPRSTISYITNNDVAGRKYFPEPMCGGVAIFDYDLDGWEDIYFTNGAKLPELKKTDPSFYHCLLRNKGDGTFEDVTKKAGLLAENLDFSYGAAAGDYDNDGYPDLFVANTGPNTLYHNNGDGTFSDVSAGSGLDRKPPGTLSIQGAWVDYDNDGRLDLVLSNYTLWTPETDRHCGGDDGTEYYCSPQLYRAVPHRLYRNLGGGKFEDVTEESGFSAVRGKGMGIAIADFNQDGWQDVFIANDTEPNLLYMNQAGRKFREMGLEAFVAYPDSGSVVSGMGCDAKDFNNDGRVDIYYSDLMGQLHALLLNLGQGQFDYFSHDTEVATLSRAFSGWSNAFIDYDNDGWKDIFSANGDVDNVRLEAKQHDTLWRNLDGKRFEDVSQQAGKDFLRLGFQRGSAVGDLNNDGFLDIVVTSLNDAPRILLNSADNGNHWLLLDLEGRSGNRDAIGAEVRLTTESGRVLYNHVTASVGFLSSSDKRVHFGLGRENRLKLVRVRWPGGKLQELRDVRADQILKVREPD